MIRANPKAIGRSKMRAKIKKTIRFAADALALVGFFTVMYFVWIATGA